MKTMKTGQENVPAEDAGVQAIEEWRAVCREKADLAPAIRKKMALEVPPPPVGPARRLLARAKDAGRKAAAFCAALSLPLAYPAAVAGSRLFESLGAANGIVPASLLAASAAVLGTAWGVGTLMGRSSAEKDFELDRQWNAEQAAWRRHDRLYPPGTPGPDGSVNMGRPGPAQWRKDRLDELAALPPASGRDLAERFEGLRAGVMLWAEEAPHAGAMHGAGRFFCAASMAGGLRAMADLHRQDPEAFRPEELKELARLASFPALDAAPADLAALSRIEQHAASRHAARERNPEARLQKRGQRAAMRAAEAWSEACRELFPRGMDSAAAFCAGPDRNLQKLFTAAAERAEAREDRQTKAESGMQDCLRRQAAMVLKAKARAAGGTPEPA